MLRSAQANTNANHQPTILLGMLLVVICFNLGCRSLVKNQQKQMALRTARQFSLRGADALQQHKYSDAEALFSESLRHSPTDERAHWGLAEVLYQRGECQNAAQHMNEAAKMSGSNPDLMVRLGEMQYESGMIDQAIIQADMALANDWQHAKAWELKGRVLERRGLADEAIEAYHRSLMSQPNNPAVQISLASVYQEQGRPQRALATLERMSDLQNPEYDKANTWLLKGAALASLGEAEESRTCLREASLRANGQDVQLCLKLAKLQADLGDLADARANLGLVLSQDPGNQAALLVQQHLEQKFLEMPAPRGAIVKTPKINTMHASTIISPQQQRAVTSPNQYPDAPLVPN